MGTMRQHGTSLGCVQRQRQRQPQQRQGQPLRPLPPPPPPPSSPPLGAPMAFPAAALWCAWSCTPDAAWQSPFMPCPDLYTLSSQCCAFSTLYSHFMTCNNISIRLWLLYGISSSRILNNRIHCRIKLDVNM